MTLSLGQTHLKITFFFLFPRELKKQLETTLSENNHVPSTCCLQHSKPMPLKQYFGEGRCEQLVRLFLCFTRVQLSIKISFR